MNALKEARIPFLLTKHENTAACAAGMTGVGYGRVSTV
jgi:thiamine pyrophosphate-dependent acetolactate synthase large subunit-like protein